MEVSSLEGFFDKDEYRAIKKLLRVGEDKVIIDTIMKKFDTIEPLPNKVLFFEYYNSFCTVYNKAIEIPYVMAKVAMSNKLTELKETQAVPIIANKPRMMTAHSFKSWLVENYRPEYELFKNANIVGLPSAIYKEIKEVFLLKKYTLSPDEFSVWYEDFLARLADKGDN